MAAQVSHVVPMEIQLVPLGTVAAQVILVKTVPFAEVKPEKFEVNVILQKDNNYFYNAPDSTTIASVKMLDYPHVLPSGTKVEIFDIAQKKLIQYHLVHEKHSSLPIPTVPKDTRFAKFESEYLVNHRGLTVVVPTDTQYTIGPVPPTKASFPIEFILPQRCRMILPKGTLLRAMNGRDAQAFPMDKVAFLADVIINI